MKVFGVCFVIFNFFLSSLESKVISDAAENKVIQGPEKEVN